MPYVILSLQGEEIDRCELSAPLVIGRSAECDLAVRDILLSRKHCRLEPIGSGERQRWRLVDLESRNGSHFNSKKIRTHTFSEGDRLRVGRTWIEFHQGKFVPPPADSTPKKSKSMRPADPHEALAGTVSDFVYVEPDAGQEYDPAPSPMHGDEEAPAATLYNPSILHELSESVSGISVMAPPKKRLATTVRVTLPKRIVQTIHTDLSLQADPKQATALAAVIERVPLTTTVLIGCGILVATAMVLVSAWIIANG